MYVSGWQVRKEEAYTPLSLATELFKQWTPRNRTSPETTEWEKEKTEAQFQSEWKLVSLKGILHSCDNFSDHLVDDTRIQTWMMGKQA